MKKSIMTRYLPVLRHQYILSGACRDFNMLMLLFNDFFTSTNLFWEVSTVLKNIFIQYSNFNDLHILDTTSIFNYIHSKIANKYHLAS